MLNAGIFKNEGRVLLRAQRHGNFLFTKPFSGFRPLEEELWNLTLSDYREHMFVNDQKLYGRVNCGEFPTCLVIETSDLLKLLGSLGQGICVYHSHPPICKKGKFTMWPPSSADMKTAFELSSYFPVTCRVVEQNGVWEYSVNGKFRNFSQNELRNKLYDLKGSSMNKHLSQLSSFYQSHGCDVLFRKIKNLAD